MTTQFPPVPVSLDSQRSAQWGLDAPVRTATRQVRAGLESDRQHGAVVPPIHLSSNFTFASFDQKRTYDYTRSGNPTRDLLAQALADVRAVCRQTRPSGAQQQGPGAMVSFELAGGQREIEALLTGLRCFSLAESLGGVESLIAHPATMTHAAMEPEARHAAGVHDNLLRLSVGIEAVEDLVADLEAGLERALDCRSCPRSARAIW